MKSILETTDETEKQALIDDLMLVNVPKRIKKKTEKPRHEWEYLGVTCRLYDGTFYCVNIGEIVIDGQVIEIEKPLGSFSYAKPDLEHEVKRRVLTLDWEKSDNDEYLASFFTNVMTAHENKVYESRLFCRSLDLGLADAFDSWLGASNEATN